MREVGFNVNVLVPHIAALFKLLIAKANIPRPWKEAKFTPIHKKGPVTRPGNYRMIATCGTLYSLYINLLCSIIQDWCIRHNKIQMNKTVFIWAEAPCNPSSFFNIKSMLHRECTVGHHGCMLHFFYFKQAYDCSPKNKLGGHFRICQMPDHILSI